MNAALQPTTNTPPERLLLKVPEAAIMLGISRAKAYELCNMPMEYGGLPVVRIGTHPSRRAAAMD